VTFEFIAKKYKPPSNNGKPLSKFTKYIYLADRAIHNIEGMKLTRNCMTLNAV
jgi:hypothetical protein